MSPHWKKIQYLQKANHHFPELAASHNVRSWFWNLTGYRNSLFILLVINFIAGIFYLTQTNLTATSGYQIKSLETELADLTEQNKNFNLSYIRLQSMDQIINGASSMQLVPADNAETIEAGGSIVAINR